MGSNKIRKLLVAAIVVLAPVATTNVIANSSHTTSKKSDGKSKKKPAVPPPAKPAAAAAVDTKPKTACPPDQTSKVTELTNQVQSMTPQIAELQGKLKEEQGKNERLATELKEAKEQGLSGTFSFLITLILLIVGPVGLGFFVRKELEHGKGHGSLGGGLPSDVVKTGPVFEENSNPPKSRR